MGTTASDPKFDDATLPDGVNERIISDRENLILRLRRGKRGIKKTWYYRYQLHGVPSKLLLGSYPALTLQKARELAAEADRQRQSGVDPIAARRADEARVLAETTAARLSVAPVTVADLAEMWLRTSREVKRHEDGGRYVRAAFVNHVLPTLGPIHLAHLRARHITGLLDRIHATGKARTCGVVLSLLRQVLQWAVLREFVAANVAAGLSADHWDGKGESRERVLSDDEICQLYHALTYATMPTRWRHTILLMLSCGTRVEETMLTERKHVDLAKRTWLLPAEKRKKTPNASPEDLLVELSDFAAEQMQALLQLGGDRYVFAQRRDPGKPERPTNHKTLSHLIGDRQTDTPKPGRTQYIGELRLADGHWTTHDLRRTCATGMGELGVRPDIIKRCLGQKIGDRITQTYQRQKMRPEMRAAWAAWGAKLRELVDAAASDTATAKATLTAMEAAMDAKRKTRAAKFRATWAAKMTKAKAEKAQAQQAADAGRQNKTGQAA